MFKYERIVDIGKASKEVVRLVTNTRDAIAFDKDYGASGHLFVRLNNTYMLSIVNNSHDFKDAWEGAAILEVGILKDGKLLCDEDGNNSFTIVDGVDYKALARLFDRIGKLGINNVFYLWRYIDALRNSR